MKLEQLKHFQAAAKHQHLAKAGQQIAISPSAIWHSIRALEQEFGQKLFHKEGRQIVLTEQGKRLQRKATALLGSAEALKNDMRIEDTPLAGHYRLAATHGFAETLLMPAWGRLQHRYPELTGEVYTFRSHDIIEKVGQGELDFGICLSPHLSSQIEGYTLKTEGLFLALRQDHPIFSLPAATQLTALANYPAALPKSRPHVLSCEKHPALISYDIQPRVTLTYDHYAIAVTAIAHSDLWSLLPEHLVTRHADTIRALVPPGWQADYEITLIWQTQFNDSQIKNQLIDAVLEHID